MIHKGHKWLIVASLRKHWYERRGEYGGDSCEILGTVRIRKRSSRKLDSGVVFSLTSYASFVELSNSDPHQLLTHVPHFQASGKVLGILPGKDQDYIDLVAETLLDRYKHAEDLSNRDTHNLWDGFTVNMPIAHIQWSGIPLEIAQQKGLVPMSDGQLMQSLGV